MQQRIAFALCALAVGLVPLSAHAAPLIATFGGPAGFGTNNLAPNDDGSSTAIDLTPAFPGGLRFFGGPYTTCYVNNNGNITFAAPVGAYTPTPFPIASQPMIAPYWGDVDTRGDGRPGRNGVYWHLEPGRMVVTWHNVGYFYQHDDHQMDFQLIITNALDCASSDFDVEFRYNTCGWTTGDASGGSGGFGGTPAQAGFDAGNMVDFVEIPGSRTASILNVCTTSNVGMPGIWQFSVRGGGVVCPGTGEMCPTGGMGACSIGITQCVGRDVVCMPIGSSTPERCDGIDNDCNGVSDDGALCPPTTVCAAGVCVPTCFEGACGPGDTCNAEGVCVETACIDVVCGADQRCSGGVCVGACEGIVCPHGQQCVAGHCTDLCDILTCGADQVCQDGMCIPTCPCHACTSEEICGSDGVCTPIGCDIVTCDPGLYCMGGACLDACDGAVCPEGQHCETGDCVENPATPDAGMSGFDDAQVAFPDSGVAPGADSGNGGLDSGVADGGPRRNRTAGACACRIGEAPRPLPTWAWGALGALGLVLARRRGRRA